MSKKQKEEQAAQVQAAQVQATQAQAAQTQAVQTAQANQPAKKGVFSKMKDGAGKVLKVGVAALAVQGGVNVYNTVKDAQNGDSESDAVHSVKRIETPNDGYVEAPKSEIVTGPYRSSSLGPLSPVNVQPIDEPSDDNTQPDDKSPTVYSGAAEHDYTWWKGYSYYDTEAKTKFLKEWAGDHQDELREKYPDMPSIDDVQGEFGKQDIQRRSQDLEFRKWVDAHYEELKDNYPDIPYSQSPEDYDPQKSKEDYDRRVRNGSGFTIPKEPDRILPNVPGFTIPIDPTRFLPNGPDFTIPKDPDITLPGGSGFTIPKDPGLNGPNWTPDQIPNDPGLTPSVERIKFFNSVPDQDPSMAIDLADKRADMAAATFGLSESEDASAETELST